jgi:hypothetical protein
MNEPHQPGEPHHTQGSRAEERPAPDDYVEFVRVGAHVKGAFECTACSHRIITTRALPACASCGEGLWERSAWSPFSEFTSRAHSLLQPI